MKRLTLLAACLVVFAALIFTACEDSAPADTTAPNAPDAVTDAPTDASTDASTDTPTDTPTDGATNDTPADTPTEAPTDAPTEPFTPPTADPTEASDAGLPLDGNSYTVGGENPAVAPKTQFDYLKTYAHAYADKTFTVYGYLSESADGMTVISLGDDMELVAYFPAGNAPVTGSYVKLTATFVQTVDKGDYVDMKCFTLMATAVEVLSEAQGPNGGKFMYITASSLNVRTSSDTSSSDNILGQLSKGDMVEVFEQDEKGWYRIIFNGQKAYISNKYVSETKP